MEGSYRDIWRDLLNLVPEHSDDYQWDMMFDLLFQDSDDRMLHAGWADGVENPDADLNQALGIGDRLRPEKWFVPFGNIKARDSDRGFRR